MGLIEVSISGYPIWLICEQTPTGNWTVKFWGDSPSSTFADVFVAFFQEQFADTYIHSKSQIDAKDQAVVYITHRIDNSNLLPGAIHRRNMGLRS